MRKFSPALLVFICISTAAIGEDLYSSKKFVQPSSLTDIYPAYAEKFFPIYVKNNMYDLNKMYNLGFFTSTGSPYLLLKRRPFGIIENVDQDKLSRGNNKPIKAENSPIKEVKHSVKINNKKTKNKQGHKNKKTPGEWGKSFIIQNF